MEIERKYLVSRLPEGLDAFAHTEIEQGYLCTSPTLRIRKAGDACILTVKEHCQPLPGGSTAIVNREEEFALPAATYARLRTKCEGVMVCKTRYYIPVGVYTAELDIFHGVHEGLRLVEVEFPSVEAADAFIAPAWFGPDVSTDPHYRNSWLSANSNTRTTI